jgi:hypothetical protein
LTLLLYYLSHFSFHQSKILIHNIPSNWPISVAETKKEIFRLTRLIKNLNYISC